MNENHRIHLVDIPIGGKAGFVWNHLHGEREDVCEALLKDLKPASQVDQRRELLQARLRKIDDALDRLMSGSYGICSKCGRSIEDATLDVDAASPLCLECSVSEPRSFRAGEIKNEIGGSSSKIILQNLTSFDTVLVKTENSEYRILLLDPKAGRALVEGGSYVAEPTEALVRGSAIPGSLFEDGIIGVGSRLEMWVAEKVLLTSPIESVEVKHNAPVESVEKIAEALFQS